MQGKIRKSIILIFTALLAAVLFAGQAAAREPAVVIHSAVGSPPQCQLASLIQVQTDLPRVGSEVSSQMTAICEAPYSELPQTDLATKLERSASVCGGEPGQTVSSTIFLDGDLANLSSIGATFDQEGCADLSDAFGQANLPLSPTALQLVSVSTSSRFGWSNPTGLTGLFVFFLLVTTGWVFMLSGIRSEAGSE